MDAPSKTLRRAKSLRGEMTLPEVLLWSALRPSAGSDVRFRRQHPCGPDILDFYCASARLAVEIDGIAHTTGDHPQRDAIRDRWLRSRGIRVMRLAAAEVMLDVDGAARGIIAAAHDSPLRPSGPLPPEGEDL
jgi:very-short-patch-repair endonuclease